MVWYSQSVYAPVQPSTLVVSAGNMSLGSESATNTLPNCMTSAMKRPRKFEMETSRPVTPNQKPSKVMRDASRCPMTLGDPRRYDKIPVNLYRTMSLNLRDIPYLGGAPFAFSPTILLACPRQQLQPYFRECMQKSVIHLAER